MKKILLPVFFNLFLGNSFAFDLIPCQRKIIENKLEILKEFQEIKFLVEKNKAILSRVEYVENDNYSENILKSVEELEKEINSIKKIKINRKLSGLMNYACHVNLDWDRAVTEFY